MGVSPLFFGRSREEWALRWAQHKSESGPAQIKTKYNDIDVMDSQPQTSETVQLTEIQSTGFLPTGFLPTEIQDLVDRDPGGRKDTAGQGVSALVPVRVLF